MLPNFLIVGAPKAGTTSLCHYLSKHPSVFISSPKEINYFSRDEIIAQNLYYKDFKAINLNQYKKLFKKAKDRIAVGEGSVSYLFYPETPQKIKKIIPNVKIIILLRDPINRGFSHFLMDLRLGLVNNTFEEIIKNNNNTDLYYQQYIELGLYYQQVKRYIDNFGKDRVKIYLQDDMRDNMKDVLKDLFTFLEIDNSMIPKINKKYNIFSISKYNFINKIYVFHRTRKYLSKILPNNNKEYLKKILFQNYDKPKLNDDIKTYLLSVYLDDINNLEQLINRDLSNWKKIT